MRHELLPELSGYSLAEDNKRPREYSSEREKWILLALIFLPWNAGLQCKRIFGEWGLNTAFLVSKSTERSGWKTFTKGRPPGTIQWEKGGRGGERYLFHPISLKQKSKHGWSANLSLIHNNLSSYIRSLSCRPIKYRTYPFQLRQNGLLAWTKISENRDESDLSSFQSKKQAVWAAERLNL